MRNLRLRNPLIDQVRHILLIRFRLDVFIGVSVPSKLRKSILLNSELIDGEELRLGASLAMERLLLCLHLKFIEHWELQANLDLEGLNDLIHVYFGGLADSLHVEVPEPLVAELECDEVGCTFCFVLLFCLLSSDFDIKLSDFLPPNDLIFLDSDLRNHLLIQLLYVRITVNDSLNSFETFLNLLIDLGLDYIIVLGLNIDNLLHFLDLLPH